MHQSWKYVCLYRSSPVFTIPFVFPFRRLEKSSTSPNRSNHPTRRLALVCPDPRRPSLHISTTSAARLQPLDVEYLPHDTHNRPHKKWRPETSAVGKANYVPYPPVFLPRPASKPILHCCETNGLRRRCERCIQRGFARAIVGSRTRSILWTRIASAGSMDKIVCPCLTRSTLRSGGVNFLVQFKPFTLRNPPPPA